MEQYGMVLVGAMLGGLAGIGIGMVVSWSMLEKYYSGISRIETLLKDFKSEGHDSKWLK